jgi:glycosyltransferase involved in cell wall biosynthesis
MGDGGELRLNRPPRLSIGLPVYNGENYLAESLEALLGQTYENFELIISDNGSTDATPDICHRYVKADSRVQYYRQPENIGSTPNHNFVFAKSRGELFKWAAADDLYARNLLECCVRALEEYPRVVLAHSWTAAIDSDGNVTQALEYPLATNSARAPERFRSMLFGTGRNDYGVIRADDQYGVIRAKVLRRVAPHGSHYHADRTIMTEIALYGPFHQTPDWLYFRRDHPRRPGHAYPTVRGWCTNLDPRRANRIWHPTVRLLAEYVLGYVRAIERAPISRAERLECYSHLLGWLGSRSAPALGRAVRGGVMAVPAGAYASAVVSDAIGPTVSLDTIVAGRGDSPCPDDV